MRPFFRTLALSATLAAVSSAASAAQQVKLDFNQFGTQSTDLPVAVGTLQGLQFGGAYGYGLAMLDNDDPDGLDSDPDVGGFILNKQRNAAQQDIVISLVRDPVKDLNVFFTSISFDLFSRGTTKVYGTDAAGKESFVRDFTAGGAVDTWGSLPDPIPLDESKKFVSLRLATNGNTLALDNMLVTLTDPGQVPEPGSFALAGLALLAAGAARRRVPRP